MPLRLRVVPPASRSGSGPTPAGAERAVDFDDSVDQIRIGRRPDLELSLPYAPLSGVHARLLRATGSAEWLLEDLGSTNGTFVGDERLKPGAKHPISAGTQIRLAEVKVIFDGEPKREAKNDATKVMPSAELPVKIPTKSPATPVLGTPVKGALTPASGSAVKSAEAPAAKSAEAARVAELQAMAAELQARVADMKARTAEPPVKSAAPTVKSAEAPVKSDKSGSKRVEPTETFVRRQTNDAIPVAPAANTVPYLSAVAGISSGNTKFRFEQRDHTYMFGRTRRCEFRVNTSEVSREHASFTRRSDGGIYVNDLGSVNGVLVNNTRVTDFRLYDGDLIQLGHIKLRLFDPTETVGRDSAAHTPSRLAPHEHGAPVASSPPPPERSVPFQAHAHAPADYHPAIAGALAAEGGLRPRRQSVRVMFTQGWESSSKFRYGVVIVVAALLAAGAVVVGFSFLG